MSITKTIGTITKIEDLSKTAKDVTVTLPVPLNFTAGHFVNVFMDIHGEKVRRAFSIASSDNDQTHFTLSIRESLKGVMSPLFWEKDLTGSQLELMGPMGVNTADKLHAPQAVLAAYGVGAGVVKSILDHILRSREAKKIVVLTGSRSEDEILHKSYFDEQSLKYPHVEIRHVISQPGDASAYRRGYIQEHIDHIDFNNTDVYACGQEAACKSLVDAIELQKPAKCKFFTEAFH